MTTTIEVLKPNGHCLISVALDAKVARVLRKFARGHGLSLEETASCAFSEVLAQGSAQRRR